ncbi:hypothetical protein HMPREF1208_00601 [Staphylococcus sp. HGB0015]|uniref:Uncharacterized protein n=1 Tax=Staphylococcus schleiferi TaxID=1295 RepID=A0A7Z7VXG7_STASC|nr:hypothetical protein HMPREF1208_00601 [Staphylococcus sp. HGB0015]NHA33523.1 hypothetical protein [Staphylococcus schleiferi]NHA38136.1 hypothetical protein [Staphylococcus schleiferi]NHA40233.1 hypothetical protein [Staphylococcus schleiferi]NHA42580.1 hypothetical protein [Staphylococcus schleiferi]
MLIKNKWYLSILIIIFIVAFLMASNVKVFDSSFWTTLFNGIMIVNFLLIFIGALLKTDNKRNRIYFK